MESSIRNLLIVSSAFIIILFCTSVAAIAASGGMVQFEIGSGYDTEIYNFTSIGTFGGDHYFEGLGLMSGYGSGINPQNLGVSVSTPAVPSSWDKGGRAWGTASSLDYLFFEGDQDESGKMLVHFDINGTVTNPLVNNTFPYNEMTAAISVRLDQSSAGDTFYYKGEGKQVWYDETNISWSGDYWLDIDGFDRNLDFSVGLSVVSYISPDHPAQTINFANTLSYYVSELTDRNGNALSLDLMSSTSGTDYTQSNVPIPGAIWLLGSGLIGIAGFRKKFKK